MPFGADAARSLSARWALGAAALGLTAMLVTACGAAAATPTPAPTPTYTRAQSDACATDDLKIDFGGEAPAAEQLYFSTLGDLSTARKQAAKVAANEAKIVATFTGTGADVEATALHSALLAGAAAFAKPMSGESVRRSIQGDQRCQSGVR